MSENGTGNKVFDWEWVGMGREGNDYTGMRRNGNNKSNSRTPLVNNDSWQQAKASSEII